MCGRCRWRRTNSSAAGGAIVDVAVAKRTLLRHAEGAPSEAPDTLLTSLRPFRGIQEQHFLEILHAIVILAPKLNCQAQVDREVVHAIWDLCRTARAWTRGPREPMFHGPRFIPPDKKKVLDEWIDTIESITLDLLRGQEVWLAFLGMPWYVLRYRFGVKAAFLTEIFVEALRELQKEETASSIDDEVMICEVFGAMGAAAKNVVPALRDLQAHTKLDAVRSAVIKALQSIVEPAAAPGCGDR